MISYQWADQQVMKKVYDELKLEGFHLWMDIYEMSGSTTDAMARAVERPILFLCVSRKSIKRVKTVRKKQNLQINWGK